MYSYFFNSAAKNHFYKRYVVLAFIRRFRTRKLDRHSRKSIIFRTNGDCLRSVITNCTNLCFIYSTLVCICVFLLSTTDTILL